MLPIFVASLRDGSSIAQLDTLAKQRDVARLSAFVDNLPAEGVNPLRVIQTNGAYECGKFGWRAFEMSSSTTGAVYVVLSTPLTSEDNGEFLFKRAGSKLHLIPEDDARQVHLDRHHFDVRFNVKESSTRITDILELHTKGDGDFFFRMSPEFRVASVSDRSGRMVKFAQAGGVVALSKPASGEEKYQITYEAKIDRPRYSASIESAEATLTNCYWYPMVARQPAPYEVTVHYPTDWVAIGQGLKLQEVPGETSYRMDLPCVFYSLSVGPYKTGKFQSGDLTLYSWSPRLPVSALEVQAETYAAILRFYSRFAPFPFKSYGGLDSPGYGGGALEAYSYATYGGGFPYVDAHEPSHTWWGGIIDNTYLHSFWNESFAVYSDELFHREWTGSEGNRLAFIPKGETSSVYDQYACATAGADLGPAASDLGYGKGSHVLFMLEKLIGNEAMMRSMRRFIKDQPSEKAAEWEDFERAAEAETPDKDLRQFFRDWLDRPGHVDFSASVNYSSGAVMIDYKVKGKPFLIPLEILLRYPDGKQETKIVEVRESKLYSVPVTAKPSLVSLDPYRYLIRPIGPDEDPLTMDTGKVGMQISTDPAHPDWGERFGNGTPSSPQDRNGFLFVGSPASRPELADLFEKAGFKVSGTTLTYRGKSIDLNHGAAEAIFDLGGGKKCGIGLGKTRLPLEAGSATVGIFDDLGRLIDGEVEPKTSGPLTYNLAAN